ncbi:MAG: ATP-dependent zinc metalloprotease FtsH [Planctomycetota bacterium]
MMAVIVVLVVMVIISMFNDEGSLMGQREEISQIAFWEKLYAGQIAEVEQEGELRLTGRYRGGGQQAQGFTVEFPARVLANRYNEIGQMVSAQFDQIRASEFLTELGQNEIVVTEAYTISRKDETLVYARFARDSERDGRSRLKYWAIDGAQDPNELIRAIKAHVPQLEIVDHAFDNPDALKSTQPNTWMTSLLVTLAPRLLIIALFWFFLMRQMRSPGGGGGVLSFGRSRAQMVNKEKSTVTFEDVAGVEEAKEEVNEIIEFLKNPNKFSRLGGRIPRGVLLVGPPGTGKTLLAKAIAGEANAPFFSISGSDFVEMFVGVGASRVRDLFRQAREHSPCLIFLDEIDAVGRKRGSGMGGGHDEREQTLNAILVEMDGFDTDEGIILVAATNRPDVLDPALLRPGRFDRQIIIGLPDLKGRKEIIQVHMRKVEVEVDLDLNTLARVTPGFSGAELAAMVNEAALIATLKNRDSVLLEDFEEARDKVRWGRQKKGRVMEEEDRLVTAYHEAGHALVAHSLDDVEPLHKVTIIPRGMSLGATMVLPERDRYNEKRKEVLGYITFAYGGRSAEELLCDDISTGAYDDIRRATELARQMVCQWGMSESIGPISYSESSDTVFLGQDLVRSRGHSESTSIEIDREIKRILVDCHQRAQAILADAKDALLRIADALMKYETLTGAEVAAIVEGRDIEQVRRDEAREVGERERKKAAESVEETRMQKDGLEEFGDAQPEPA